MARLEESAGVDLLRHANRSLREFLARNGEAVQGSDDDVQAMLEVERTLRAVGGELERLQHTDCPDVRVELELYRDNLVRLRRQLAIMQSAATECHARLFVREKHLRAAHEWCAATRTTG
jgi:hypothetical protein